MKMFAIAFVLLLGQAQADTPEYKASKFKCADLQAALVKHKSLVVFKSFMGIKKRWYVDVKVDCSYDEVKETAYFSTVDDKFCEVGEYCAVERTGWDWGSSGSYDSGYSSGSSYDSGWSSSGSSWSSGSSSSGSSSSGSNYNPPSSGSTGSNYNPPSSGTRGPRYCPGCAQ